MSGLDGAGIVTERLLLSRWRDELRAAFAELNADPRVTRWLAGPLTRADSDAWIDATERSFDTEGFGVWAVETRPAPGRQRAFVGAVGLKRTRAGVPFAPCVEILWRLRFEMQRNGYATEAARAALRDAFERPGTAAGGGDGIVAFTSVGNVASRRVMEKIGMHRVADGDFDHPALPPGHPLRRHVLYRAPRPG